MISLLGWGLVIIGVVLLILGHFIPGIVALIIGLIILAVLYAPRSRRL